MPVFPDPTSLGSPPQTTLDLINETLQYLNSSYHEQINELTNTITASDDTITFAHSLGGIKPGVNISIGLEDLYVWSTSETALSAEVKRGMRGSTPTVHTTDEPVVVKPLYSHFSILRALNNDLTDLASNGLFQVKTLELTWDPMIYGYDLSTVTDLLSVLEVRYQDSNTVSQRWPIIPNGEYQLSRNMSGPFASSLALFFTSGGISQFPILIKYSAPFTYLSALDDNVTDTAGLPPSSHRLLPLGAAIALAGSQEIKRNMTENQGDTRRATEVPAGARSAAIRPLQQLRQQWLIDETTRLRKSYPFQSTIGLAYPRGRVS